MWSFWTAASRTLVALLIVGMMCTTQASSLSSNDLNILVSPTERQQEPRRRTMITTPSYHYYYKFGNMNYMKSNMKKKKKKMSTMKSKGKGSSSSSSSSKGDGGMYRPVMKKYYDYAKGKGAPSSSSMSSKGGKGKGGGGSYYYKPMMSYKGKGSPSMSSMGKGKGKGGSSSSMMSKGGKGKGGSSSSSMMSKGKGMSFKGKGGPSSSLGMKSYKGKGMTSSMSSKGKGGGSSGKGKGYVMMRSYKGKGGSSYSSSSSKGKGGSSSRMGKGKGGGSPRYMMSKGKGVRAKGKGGSFSSGMRGKGKGIVMASKGKGLANPTAKGKGFVQMTKRPRPTLAPTERADVVDTPSAVPSIFPSTSIFPTTSAVPTASAVPTSSLLPSLAPSTSASPTTSEQPSITPSLVPSDTPTAVVVTSTPTSVPTFTPGATTTSTVTPGDGGGTPSTQVVYGLQPDCFIIDETRFNICLDITSASGQVEDWFTLLVQAKEEWERIIATDPWPTWSAATLEEFVPPEARGTVTEFGTDLPNGVDDIYVAIFVLDVSTDGRGGSIAAGGPRRILGDAEIQSGRILIDPGDLNPVTTDTLFYNIMLHELGHVVGLGTKWGQNDLLPGLDVIDSASLAYTGTNGLAAWRDLGCSGDLPLEVDLGHWDEACLNNELMTATYLEGQGTITSAITMGALEDLGYTVDRNQQEAFTLADLGTCGDACPEADATRRQRRLGSPQSTTLEPKLSQQGKNKLWDLAAEQFRNEARFQAHAAGSPSSSKITATSETLSYIYEENGHYHSRIIHQKQVQHLL